MDIREILIAYEQVQAREVNMKYKGIQYRCPSCGDLYAYAKKCAGCGTKTVKIDKQKEGGEDNE